MSDASTLARLEDRLLRVERMRVGDIAAHARNPKRHPVRQQEALRETLRTLGQADVLKAYHSERNGGALTLYDGHARQGLDPDQEWHVAVFDLTDAEADDWLRYADPIAALAEVDNAILAALLEDASTDSTLLAALLSERAAGAGLFTGVGASAAPGDDDADVPEDGPTRVQLGEVWRVGDHIVACLDSTDRANVEAAVAGRKVGMVWADPPYAIGAVDLETGQTGGLGRPGGGYPFGGAKNDGKSKPVKSRVYAPVIGDDSIDTAVESVLLCLDLFPKAKHAWWGANNYAHVLPPSTCWIVWDKENGTNAFADAELAWTNDDGAVRVFRHMWNGMLRASEQGERTHPTQKPVALCLWAFDKYGAVGDVILDPFLGSGPSLKATHRLGNRTVVGFELSPHYCDHIIEWAEAEGLHCECIATHAPAATDALARS